MTRRSFRYYVTVGCESAAEADTVMAEKLLPEEELGFEYLIYFDFIGKTEYEEEE